jgi:hypothetical protein
MYGCYGSPPIYYTIYFISYFKICFHNFWDQTFWKQNDPQKCFLYIFIFDFS